MSRKLISAQRPFRMLVANLRQGSNPSLGPVGNPQVIRRTYETQHFIEIGGRGPEVGTPDHRTPGVGTRVGNLAYTTPGVPIAASGTLTVALNVFGGPTIVQIGQYTLTSGIDFAVGGGTAATATSLAAAIDALPGYMAPVPGGSVISVEGPSGVIGNEVAFYSDGASPFNFVFSPTGGTMGGAEPVIGPPILT